MTLFIEVENEDSADYMVNSYNKKIKKEKDKYIERIYTSKVKILMQNNRPSTVLVDDKDEVIGLIYPIKLLETKDFVTFIRQFKDEQILKVKNVKYGVQKRYFKVGIGFEIEIE